MDYYFITKEGIKRRDELAAELGDDSEETVTQAHAKGQLVKCMAVRCFKSKNAFTHVVLQKGDDEDHYCAKLVASDVEWLGHTSVILKSDNEKATVSVKERTARICANTKASKMYKLRVHLPTILNPTEASKQGYAQSEAYSGH